MDEPPATTEERFGDWLRTALSERGVAVKQLADALGVSTPTIYHWMRRPTPPHDETKARIERAIASIEHAEEPSDEPGERKLAAQVKISGPGLSLEIDVAPATLRKLLQLLLTE